MKGLMKTIVGTCAVAIGVTAFAGETSASTGLYVGKDASADGTIIIGRANDYDPGILSYAGVVEAGEIKAGDSYTQQNGFSYILPEDCAKYNYFKTMDYFVDKENEWGFADDACATNEYGVSVNATINGFTNVNADDADPFVESGIGQELIPQILVSNSKTAREAVELLATIIDENGSQTGNIILVSDTEEAWIFESLTGHQYVAVRLPDDVATVFGDEFIVRTVNPEEEDVITSADLFKLPEDNDFAVYIDDEKIDLIKTYSSETVDFSHLRTWVGHELLAPSQSVGYVTDVDIPAFYTPDEKVSLEKIFSIFRNRFEGTPYEPKLNEGEYVRCINEQYNNGVYINQTYCDVPKEIAVVTWATPGNVGFTPFLPFANGADEILESYSTNAEEDAFDSSVAQMKYARLSANCYPRREAYGNGVRDVWEFEEALYISDISEKIYEWKDLYENSSRRAVKDINGYVEEILQASEKECDELYDSMEWHFIRSGILDPAYSDDEIIDFGYGFEPGFDVEEYAQKSGWGTEVDGNVLTATKGDKKIVLDASVDGDVTLYGFSEDELEGLNTVAEDIVEEDVVEDAEDVVEEDIVEDAEETVEEDIVEDAEETVEEDIVEDVEETVEEDVVEDVEETVEEDVVEDTEEVAEDVAEEAEEIIDEEAFYGDATVSDFEVGLLFELQKFFAGEVDEIPELGLSRKEAEKYLNDMANESVKVVEDYFGKNLDEISFYDIADEDIQAEAEALLNEASVQIAELINEYYDEELINTVYELGQQVSAEELADIVSAYSVDISGMVKAYLLEMIDPVINTDLDEEEIREILEELGTNAKALMEDYLGYSIESIDIDIDLGQLGIDLSDEEVADVLSNLDPEIVDGLSEIMGVDVGQAIDDFVIEVEESKTATKKKTDTEKKPVTEQKKEKEVEVDTVKNEEYRCNDTLTQEVKTVAEIEPMTEIPVQEPTPAETTPAEAAPAPATEEAAPVTEEAVPTEVTPAPATEEAVPTEVTPAPATEEVAPVAQEAVEEKATDDVFEDKEGDSTKIDAEKAVESTEEITDTVPHIVVDRYKLVKSGGKFYASTNLLKYFK